MFSTHNPNEFRHTDSSSPPAVEPMSLGSPVSSPSNLSQNYLPPYLFGEVVTTPIGATSWTTPNKQYNSSFSSCQIQPVSQLKEKKNVFSPISSTLINSPNTGKSGGPPVQGLIYSTPPVTSFNVSKLNDTQNTSIISESFNTSGVLTSSKLFSINNTSHLSPAQIDPFFTQGETLKTSEQLDESWVTIFGFPSASTTYILQQFSQYGNIAEHKVSTGNWIHIKYQSKLQAKKALSKNGKIFGGNIMVGVKPCIEMDLMESVKENSNIDTSSTLEKESIDNTGDVLTPTKPNLKNIRPLTQAYRIPSEVRVSSPNAGGIVSKAIQYIWKL